MSTTEKPLVMLSQEELRELIRGAVRAELGAVRAEEREILTREQASALMGCNPVVLVRFVKHEGLPGYKVGPEWRFRRSELMRWLADHAVKPGAHTEKHGKRLRAMKETG